MSLWACILIQENKAWGVRCQNVGQAGTVTTRLKVMQAKRGGMPVSIYTSQHGMPIKRDMVISYCRNFACFRIWIYHWSIQYLLWFVQSPCSGAGQISEIAYCWLWWLLLKHSVGNARLQFRHNGEVSHAVVTRTPHFWKLSIWV